MNRFLMAVALTLLSITTFAAPAITKNGIPPKQYTDMSFRIFIPCSGNASFCAPTVLAKGLITADSATQLEALIKTHQKLSDQDPNWLAPYARVCLDSPGGSLAGGIRLGETIQRLKLDTCIAPAYVGSDRAGSGAFLEKNVVCASACVFAFAGGVNRTADQGSRIGVHQFYSNSGQIGDGSTQAAVVWLAEYLERVGVSRKLLDLSSLVPADQIYWLEPKQIHALNLDNTAQHLNSWQIHATPEGNIWAWVSQPKSSGEEGNVTQLVLMRAGGAVTLLIRGEFHSRFATSAIEGARALNLNDGRGKVTIRIDDRFSIVRAVQWRPNNEGKGVIAVAQLNRSEALALALAKSLTFDADCPHILDRYDLSTAISTEGVSGAIRAVLR